MMSGIIGIIGLLLAIAVLVVGAYKGLGAFPLTIIAALVAIVTNAPNLATIFTTNYVWDKMSGVYMGGYVSAYLAYLLMLAASALYAKLMNDAGCAIAIGNKLVDWFGKRNAVLVSILITAVLTYGGVSILVVVYAVSPIMFLLFKEANLPRHLTMGCIVAGSSTFTMTCLPGTPQLTNVVPTEFLGTTLTAAPVFSIICSVAMFAMVYGYMVYAEKKAVANGEIWTYPANYDARSFEVKDRSQLPGIFQSFTPIVVLIAFIFIGSNIHRALGTAPFNSTMIATYAMLVGCVVAVALNWNRFKGTDWKATLTSGLGGAIAGIGGIAAVLAFGSIVKDTVSFTNIVNWVLGIDMHPYVRGVFSVSVFSGITGSSSGGLRITLEALSGVLTSSGVNMGILHRLMAIAAGGLDTLPHSPGLFLTFAILGLTHKDAYKHVFITSVAIPVVLVTAATTICIVFGI